MTTPPPSPQLNFTSSHHNYCTMFLCKFHQDYHCPTIFVTLLYTFKDKFYYFYSIHVTYILNGNFRYCTAQELVSHDIHNNTYNYKSTFSVEIVPICKDNIVCLSPKLAQQLGNLGQICICHRVTQTVHLIDPATLQRKSSMFFR